MAVIQERWVFTGFIALLLGLFAAGFAHYRWVLVSGRSHWLAVLTSSVVIGGIALWLYSRQGDSHLTLNAGLGLFAGAAVAVGCWVSTGFLVVNAGLDGGAPQSWSAEIVKTRSDRNLRFASVRFNGRSEVFDVSISRELDRELRTGMRLSVPVGQGRLGEAWFLRADFEAAGRSLAAGQP
ncbi:hypothetical protein [Hyalangium sp.]|uniref:hypothetical protein n=1 Tax=Hyalangium sp. TaxID=2028555 RepID=UPI002D42A5D6|nr:hypothetical protein [Hyalangium sp.]HYH97241.1 hypothetical protein [Hyalangium sp.]